MFITFLISEQIKVKITFKTDKPSQHWENKAAVLVKGSSPYNFLESSVLQSWRSSSKNKNLMRFWKLGYFKPI
ncbi:Uncharacterized protein TCM_043669 [Theobroma cacao]|uniref:Uncharacterized protein n=1 Tax=Theobroma cacao TaxID=3641 RepID=A0A061FPN7_THECC|nr:Uncharacterized protein TCM_043669 [Theobroma cacao]